NVVGILTLTESGNTAKWMSRISSGIAIFGVTRKVDTERRMTLYRGVYPVPFDATELPSGEVNRAVVAELQSRGLVAEGDWLIITKGDFSGIEGGTNSMKIVKVGEIAGERE
ncbi:MAG: pyruvate kinase alpha/beta domain-containing protein, partial [Arenicellales bacterium]|nr:pyruvate kinase alpha/beta domain-containing protein [Arenicellales bacterium]